MPVTSLWPPYIKQMTEEKMRNSVVDIDMTAITGTDQAEPQEEATTKKGSWFTYSEDDSELLGPYKTKGDAIQAAQNSFTDSAYGEETVWLCQAVQKVIFTRKVHVVESDE